MTLFDLGVYRRANQDLAHLSDEQLTAHFRTSGLNERREFAQVSTTAAKFSMRWLRGRGLEIGAGRNPTPLFGNTTCTYSDIAVDSAFGGSAELFFSLDAPLSGDQAGKYDFVIGSHVLEHCDSLIRGFDNLLKSLKPSGVAYIVLPDKRFLFDEHWMPYYDFDHHVREYSEPFAFARQHDREFLNSIGADVSINAHADIPPDLAAAIASGYLPDDQRFMAHKHNYRFNDWLKLLQQSLSYLEAPFVVEDAGFGRERMDCHFILAAG